MWRCPLCGSTNILVLAWVNPNWQEQGADEAVVDLLGPTENELIEFPVRCQEPGCEGMAKEMTR